MPQDFDSVICGPGSNLLKVSVTKSKVRLQLLRVENQHVRQEQVEIYKDTHSCDIGKQHTHNKQVTINE